MTFDFPHHPDMVSVSGYGAILTAISLTAVLAASSACSDPGDDSGGTGGTSTGGATATGGSFGAGTTGGATSSSGGTGNSVDLSSDPGSGICMNFTPCGGDVLGTWRVESLCMDAISPQFQNCPTAKTNVTLTGSLTFNSDGSYIPRGNSMVRTTLPPACSALCAAAGATCVAAADGGCTCDSMMPISETPLTYSVDGNKLIVHPRADLTQTAYFCRQGDQILMRGYSSATVKYQYDLRR